MTTETEKHFFDTFGIEPKHIFRGCRLGAKYYAEICDETTCNGCNEEIRKTEYPQITDRILLELICLISQHITYIDTIEKLKTVEELKTWILEEVIYQYKHYGTNNTIKHQVQALFKEE